MPFNDPETPLDPQTEADLRALAELVIADAVLHCLGHHNLDLEEAEREALARDVEAEVDAMFADADGRRSPSRALTSRVPWPFGET